MTKRQITPFLLLLFTFLIWLYFKPETITVVEKKHQLNYIAYSARNTHFDKEGAISYKIFSDKTTGLTEGEITNFEAPKVVVNVKNKNNTTSVWELTSKRGYLYKQNKLILLGDVQVKNLSKDQLIQSMTTDKLTLFLKTKEISTNRPVYWQGPQMKQQGIGLWGSLVTEELIVKDKIKAVYLNENK